MINESMIKLQVYTEIISGAKKGSTEKLVKGSTDKSKNENGGYTAEAEIDPTSSRPTVTAKLLTKKTNPEADAQGNEG